MLEVASKATGLSRREREETEKKRDKMSGQNEILSKAEDVADKVKQCFRFTVDAMLFDPALEVIMQCNI